MDRRKAHIEALRLVSALTETTIGSGFMAMETEPENEQVFKAMRAVCAELDRRADRLEGKSKNKLRDSRI